VEHRRHLGAPVPPDGGHTGFLTVARRVVPEEGAAATPRIADPETD